MARAFGLPSFMVIKNKRQHLGAVALVRLALSFLRFTLGPHLNRFEQEVNRKLFLKKPMFAEFIAANLMRLTLKDRNEAYRQAIGGSQGPGWMSIDEVRKLENLPELGGRYALPYDATASNNQQTDI